MINDVSFIGVNYPGARPGLDLWVGGGLSTNRCAAFQRRCVGAAEEVAGMRAGVVGIFLDYGYRYKVSKARLKFLVCDQKY